jgi:hypothetical protein
MAIIAGDEFMAYTFDDETREKHFFVIETEIKSDYDTFSEKAFALKNAIGYLTGYLVGDGGYFFAYTKKKCGISIIITIVPFAIRSKATIAR